MRNDQGYYDARTSGRLDHAGNPNSPTSPTSAGQTGYETGNLGDPDAYPVAPPPSATPPAGALGGASDGASDEAMFWPSDHHPTTQSGRLRRSTGRATPLAAAPAEPSGMAPQEAPQDARQTTGALWFFGRYTSLTPLAAGGMAQIYRARDARYGREVALKTLSPEMAHDPVRVERFKLEAKRVAALQHPNIVPLLDYGEEQGRLFLVMPLYPYTLRDLLDRNGPPSVTQAISITQQIAAALDHAHTYGFIHRDVKPENILIDYDGHALLTDFGIAKAAPDAPVHLMTSGPLSAAEAGQAPLASIEYSAPEHLLGRPLDARADIYSLGLVVYELFTGRVPFPIEAGRLYTYLTHIMTDQPPAPSTISRYPLPATVDGIVLRALSPDAARRFSTAGEFAAQLLQALAHAPTALPVAPFDPGIPVAPRPPSRSPSRPLPRPAGPSRPLGRQPAQPLNPPTAPSVNDAGSVTVSLPAPSSQPLRQPQQQPPSQPLQPLQPLQQQSPQPRYIYSPSERPPARSAPTTAPLTPDAIVQALRSADAAPTGGYGARSPQSDRLAPPRRTPTSPVSPVSPVSSTSLTSAAAAAPSPAAPRQALNTFDTFDTFPPDRSYLWRREPPRRRSRFARLLTLLTGRR